MAHKTWFLPPDFTFLPDGQIALGSVIPEPSRPTVTLASLVDHPTIALPKTKIITEPNHSHTSEKNRSAGLSLIAKIMALAGTKAKTDISWYKNKSFSTTDHEVRAFNGSFTPEALRAIVALENVKKHMDSGRWGKRCVYIISGLRVTPQSFRVTEEKGKDLGASLGGSGSVPTGTAPPVELETNVSASMGDKSAGGYDTSPGIVFAYRLHVIRPKGTDDEEAELFSDSTAFCSGEAEDKDEELEMVEVNGTALRLDLDVEEDGYDILSEEDDDCLVVFKSDKGEEGH